MVRTAAAERLSKTHAAPPRKIVQLVPPTEERLDGIEQRLILEMLDADRDARPRRHVVEELSDEQFDDLLASGRPEEFARLVVGMGDSFRRLLLEAACQGPMPLPHLGTGDARGHSFEQIAAALAAGKTVTLTTRPVGPAEWLSGRLFGEQPALPHRLRFAETYAATGVHDHDGTRFVRLRDEAGRAAIVPFEELAENFAAIVVND